MCVCVGGWGVGVSLEAPPTLRSCTKEPGVLTPDPSLSHLTRSFSLPCSSLPELMDRKKKIDMHTNIATALLDQIKVRLHCGLRS